MNNFFKAFTIFAVWISIKKNKISVNPKTEDIDNYYKGNIVRRGGGEKTEGNDKH